MNSILIKAGRIFDGVSDHTREHAYITVNGDTLDDIGAQSELSPHLDQFAEVIDLGPDVTILPGLINMHTHMSFSSGEDMLGDHQASSLEEKLILAVENLKLTLSTGVTTIRDCGTLNRIAFSTREAVEKGLLQGPRIIASGDGITTTGGHLWFCGIESDSETEVRRAVRSQAKAGADFIKVFATGGQTTPGTNSFEAQYSEAELCALTEEARRLGKHVAAHAHGASGVRRSIAARVTTIEHCSFLHPDGIAYEPDQGRIIADTGIFVCPTISRGRSKFLDPAMAADSEDVATYYEKRAQRYDLVRRLIADGVRIVSGSDAGIPHNTFDDYPGDLVLSVEGVDLSPLYVLKSATSVSAEALGRPDIGVLAPGKAADLLAVRGNPLDNIRALLEPEMIMARGQLVT